MLEENLELKEELAVARGVGKTSDDALTALKLSSAKDREEMISLKMQLNELSKEGESLRKKSSRVEELEGLYPELTSTIHLLIYHLIHPSTHHINTLSTPYQHSISCHPINTPLLLCSPSQARRSGVSLLQPTTARRESRRAKAVRRFDAGEETSR